MGFTPNQVNEIKKIALDQINATIPNHLPVGTVISSLLNYDKFREIVKDPAVFQKDKSKWSPADGRNVDTSKYASYMPIDKVPDMRGLFIRGLNKFDIAETTVVSNEQKDVDGENRAAGSFQNDEFKSHQHEFRTPETGPRVSYSSDAGVKANFSVGHTTANGGTETRPKNIAVYYYVKIN